MEKLPTRGACRKREAPAQDFSKHISSSIYTVIGHLQLEGSDQGLCGAAVAQFSYATCTTFWVVVAISK
jgi:protoheme ferro-lyase